jgi:hypothetical protein
MPLWRITFALSCKLPLEEVHEAAVEVETGGEGGALAAVTVMANGASDALDSPSLTLIVTFWSEPTLLEPGVPESCPVWALKVAHVGVFLMLKVSVPPLGSVTVGLKL